jgi:hypothetical protein
LHGIETLLLISRHTSFSQAKVVLTDVITPFECKKLMRAW